MLENNPFDPLNNQTLGYVADSFNRYRKTFLKSDCDSIYEDDNEALLRWLAYGSGMRQYGQTYEQLCQLIRYLQTHPSDYPYQVTSPPCTPERFDGLPKFSSNSIA